MHDTTIEVRLRAIDALHGIGTGAEDAVYPLIDILRDPRQPVDLRRHAVIAIRSIYADLALVQLSGALRDSDRVVCSNAAGGAWQHG